MTNSSVGRFPLNEVTEGDCRKLIADLPDNCIDVAVTSPPYWGQRISDGNGVEADPRAYLAELAAIFGSLLPKGGGPGSAQGHGTGVLTLVLVITALVAIIAASGAGPPGRRPAPRRAGGRAATGP